MVSLLKLLTDIVSSQRIRELLGQIVSQNKEKKKDRVETRGEETTAISHLLEAAY